MTNFLSKAPAQVVEGLRKRAQELAALREKNTEQTARATLARFSQPGHFGKKVWTGTVSAYRGYRERAAGDRATSDATSYACIDPNQRGAPRSLPSRIVFLAGLGLCVAAFWTYTRCWMEPWSHIMKSSVIRDFRPECGLTRASVL